MIHDMRFFGTANVNVSAGIKGKYSTTVGLEKSVKDISGKSDTASVSTLSRQLGESAVRAEARDKSMTRQQLSEFVTQSIAHISPESTSAKKALHDAEVPNTKNPELLERARQATIYVNKAAAQDPTAKNPFAGLTQEQAILIAHDDKGPYTANERHAAWRHGNDLEQQWRVGLIARGTQEYNASGRTPKFTTECLEHYRALPAIEQARYDAGYEDRLLARIKDQEGAPAKPSDRKLNLYDILAELQNPGKKKEALPEVEKQPASAGKVAKEVKGPIPLDAMKNDFRILTLFEILAGHRYPDNKADKKQAEGAAKSSGQHPPSAAPIPTAKTSSLSPGASPTPADARRS